MSVAAEQTETKPTGRETNARPIGRLQMMLLCAVLTAMMMIGGGYSLGVGNQSIQVAFLLHAHDASNFANDAMVRETYANYASYFFNVIALGLRLLDVATLYVALHAFTTWALLMAIASLSRALFKHRGAVLAALAIVVAGHHGALAGDPLYSSGFTHTYFVLPWAVLALAWLVRGRVVLAFVLAGLLFNLHALTGTYLAVMLAAGTLVLAEKKLRTLLVAGAAFALFAAPTLYHIATHPQTYDALWFGLMRVRSADHSFPFTWWQAGNPDVPHFALYVALAAVAWSWFEAGRERRLVRAIIAATFALFAVGIVFTEIWPSATVVRLQALRSSRILLVVLLVVIAHGVVRSFVFDRKHVLALMGAVVVLAALAVPALLVYLPWAVLLWAVAALAAGRLSWRAALAVAVALVVTMLAWRQIQFAVPGFTPGAATVHVETSNALPLAVLGLAAVVLALNVAVRRFLLRCAMTICACFLAVAGVSRFFSGPEAPPSPIETVGAYFRATTNDAVILAPAGMANLRIYGEASIVGDWRDGTQLYFAAPFANTWLSRMNDLEPGLTLSEDRRKLIARGASLDTLDDEALLALAQKYGATHIVSRVAGRNLREIGISGLEGLHVYAAEAVAPAVTTQPVPAGVIDGVEWRAAEAFYKTVVQPNVIRNRTSEVTIQIVDETGRPVYDMPFELKQTNSQFLFGASLGFFDAVPYANYGDQKPPPSNPQEREKFLEVFNASMIPFSAKWQYIEPFRNVRTYADLDQYVDFCVQNNITVQFHHLAGHQATWLKQLSALEQTGRFHEHATKLVERYGDRVKYWQVFNDKLLLNAAPPLFESLRRQQPGIKLGISDCTRFHSPNKGPTRERELCAGIDGLRQLKAMGARVDFFAMHGHYPAGLWADPREMYEVLDTYAREGVKVHITEMLLPLNSEIAGPLRRGKWTPELQAEFYERYFTVAFSHPAVEMVNLWGIGPDNWGAGSGLLDHDHNPRPAFDRLKELITQRWRTHAKGTLGLDGAARLRAFHGQYDVAVITPAGPARAKITITPETRLVRLVLTRGTGALAVQP